MTRSLTFEWERLEFKIKNPSLPSFTSRGGSTRAEDPFSTFSDSQATPDASPSRFRRLHEWLVSPSNPPPSPLLSHLQFLSSARFLFFSGNSAVPFVPHHRFWPKSASLYHSARVFFLCLGITSTASTHPTLPSFLACPPPADRTSKIVSLLKQQETRKSFPSPGRLLRSGIGALRLHTVHNAGCDITSRTLSLILAPLAPHFYNLSFVLHCRHGVEPAGELLSRPEK
jgi:hypothetical protein